MAPSAEQKLQCHIQNQFMQRINGISSASLFIANMTEPKAHGMTQVQAEQASNRTLVVVVVGEDCFGGEVVLGAASGRLLILSSGSPPVWPATTLLTGNCPEPLAVGSRLGSP